MYIRNVYFKLLILILYSKWKKKIYSPNTTFAATSGRSVASHSATFWTVAVEQSLVSVAIWRAAVSTIERDHLRPNVLDDDLKGLLTASTRCYDESDSARQRSVKTK